MIASGLKVTHLHYAQKARSSGGSVEKHTQQRSHPSRTVTSTTAGADASFSKDRWIQVGSSALLACIGVAAFFCIQQLCSTCLA